jgi:molecular chaperone GrpE
MNEHEQFQEHPQEPEKSTTHENKSLMHCERELASVKERYVRVVADFDNYKRRAEKEKATWITTGQAGVLAELLPIIDDFDRALKEHEKQEGNQPTHAWFEGFALIHKSFQKILHKYGVNEIQENVVFDPTLHEALMHVDSSSHPSGTIVEVLEKGYRFKDMVLRPAKVSVAK